MSGAQPTNQQPMKADMAIEQLSSSLKSLNCCETARSSSSYRDALDKLHATVMHISPPNAVLQSCRSSAQTSRQRSSRHDAGAESTSNTATTGRSMYVRDFAGGAVLSSRMHNSNRSCARRRTALEANQETIPQSEMWIHTQTVPGYIGGNMLLQKSLLPLKLTSRVHMRGALPMRADAMPKRSVQSQALASIDASAEASELWTLQDHFLKKSFFKPIGF